MLFNAQPPLTKGRLKMLTIEDLHTQNLLLLEDRSRAYWFGDARIRIPTSKACFTCPNRCFYGMEYIPQISNETNDIALRTGAVYRAFAAKQPEHAGTARLAARLRALPFAADGRVQNRMVCVQGLPPEFCRIRLRANQKSTRAEQEKISNPMSSEKKACLISATS